MIFQPLDRDIQSEETGLQNKRYQTVAIKQFTLYSYVMPLNVGTSSFSIQRRAGQRWSPIPKNWGCNRVMRGQGYRTVTHGHGSIVEWWLAGENGTGSEACPIVTAVITNRT